MCIVHIASVVSCKRITVESSRLRYLQTANLQTGTYSLSCVVSHSATYPPPRPHYSMYHTVSLLYVSMYCMLVAFHEIYFNIILTAITSNNV